MLVLPMMVPADPSLPAISATAPVFLFFDLFKYVNVGFIVMQV